MIKAFRYRLYPTSSQIKCLEKTFDLCRFLWSQLVQMLLYKAESADKEVVLVDPRNTSKMCSNCGNMVDKDLSERMHRCDACGLEMDRDHNAAINIFNRGMQSIPRENRNGRSEMKSQEAAH